MIYPADWTCERAQLELERYLLNALSLGDSLAVAEHVEACAGCAQRLLVFRASLVRRPRD
jgi:hypothetical protein